MGYCLVANVSVSSDEFLNPSHLEKVVSNQQMHMKQQIPRLFRLVSPDSLGFSAVPFSVVVHWNDVDDMKK